MAGGLGLSTFRSEMLADRHLRVLVDYPVSSEVFPGVEVKGGISYFLWDRDSEGTCSYSTVRGGEKSQSVDRVLDEYDILVRDSAGLGVLQRVLGRGEPSFEGLVASVRPFGDKLRSNFSDYRDSQSGAYKVPILVNERGRRVEAWTKKEYVTTNLPLAEGWKVFLPKAGSDGGQRLPNPVIGPPRIGFPGQVSTETYLAIGPFESESQARAALTYLTSRFARYLISLRKVSQDNVPSTFRWLPIPDWSGPISDSDLASRYDLSHEERAHIGAMVSAWNASDG
jgi:site-specific DNA-methyltransferase (adenine-specific)